MKIKRNTPLRIWDFYTETKEGIETIVATKRLKHPDKCTIYKNLQKQGFINGIDRYGYRIVENRI